MMCWSTMRFSGCIVVAVLALGMLQAQAATAVAAGPTVEITKFAFTPKEITVAPGTQIVWTNHDETPHTVTSADKQVKSAALDTGDRFEHVFASEGDFSYFCTLHPFMTGVVHVRK